MNMLLMRVLNNSAWWDLEVGSDESAIGADAFKNVSTQQNCLSVFEIEDPSDKSIVATAVASGRDKLADVDYCLFESRIVDQLGLRMDKTRGKTAIETANQRHLDIANLSAADLQKLLCAVICNCEIDSIDRSLMQTSFAQLIANGALDFAKMNPKLQEKVQEILAAN